MSQAENPNTTSPSRRALLAGAAAAAAAATGSIATAATGPSAHDPIFAAIEARKAALQQWCELDLELDNQRHDAIDRHGHEPFELIQWRNYHIGADELEDRRDQFIRQGEDPEAVEAEYRDAVERLER